MPEDIFHEIETNCGQAPCPHLRHAARGAEIAAQGYRSGHHRAAAKRRYRRRSHDHEPDLPPFCRFHGLHGHGNGPWLDQNTSPQHQAQKLLRQFPTSRRPSRMSKARQCRSQAARRSGASVPSHQFMPEPPASWQGIAPGPYRPTRAIRPAIRYRSRHQAGSDQMPHKTGWRRPRLPTIFCFQTR